LEEVAEREQIAAGQKTAGLRLRLPGGAQVEIANKKRSALAAVLDLARVE
jgi:hypothetical protein